jgi:hypothetical protein
MARGRGWAEAPRGDPNGKCRVRRDNVRVVQIPTVPPRGERPVARGGSDRLIAALAA